MFDIYDVLQDFRVQFRKRRGFFSYALSALTGLTTTSEVEELNDIMTKVKAGVEKAVHVWTLGTKTY